MNAEVVVVVPTLHRPQNMRALAEAFAMTTSSFRVLFVCDTTDTGSRRVARRLERALPGRVSAIAYDGNYVEKTNAGIRASVEPLVVPGADDIRPHTGWLEAAKAKMVGDVGFVSLNDLGNHDVMAGKYATLPLVARWYVESLDDNLYHEGYHHNGVDVDASLTARKRGAFAYAPDAVMEHLHPAWSKAEIDDTHRRGCMDEERASADHELLERRWPGWQDTLANL